MSLLDAVLAKRAPTRDERKLKGFLEWRRIIVMAKRAQKETPKEKLAELKAKHFGPRGRKLRIAKALETLKRQGPTFRLDRDTVKWIAQDADIEHL